LHGIAGNKTRKMAIGLGQGIPEQKIWALLIMRLCVGDFHAALTPQQVNFLERKKPRDNNYHKICGKYRIP
jgi:hypothetical protein